MSTEVFQLPNFAYALSPPTAYADLRSTAEDFCVDEILPFEPEGTGEHIFLHIKKIGANTAWVAEQLVKFLGVKPYDVSYAGLKDRHAVTTQWFSIYAAKIKQVDWADFRCEGVEILRHTRHTRKLRRGAVRANQFKLVLRAITGDQAGIESRLHRINSEGVPNYFGEQRFGHQGNNINAGLALCARPLRRKLSQKNALYVSALRSLLFNYFLSMRVEDKTWNQALIGDVMQLAGSHSIFNVEELEQSLLQRVAEADVHPAAPLWGAGNTRHKNPVGYTQILADYELVCQRLEESNLSIEYRAMRLMPQTLTWAWLENDCLTLSFQLPVGCYATTLLRELVHTKNKSIQLTT